MGDNKTPTVGSLIQGSVNKSKSAANRSYLTSDIGVPTALKDHITHITNLAYSLRDQIDAINKLNLLTRSQADALYGEVAQRKTISTQGFTNPIIQPAPTDIPPPE